MGAGSTELEAVVGRLGLESGNVVGETGYDEDVDHDLRDAIAELTGEELVDLDDSAAGEVVDGGLIWWRLDDGDLTDALVDSLTLLADDGVIWLLTPKTGAEGYVESSDITEAARTAGLSQTTSLGRTSAWMITRLSRARAPRAPRH